MIKRFVLSGMLFFMVSIAFGQKQNKVGLCLSGGGAKGLAHIGMLKLIDSLGIKIDYITGTSMGAVVGGLYAAGYTAKQIDSIAKTAQWEVLLSQNPPLSNIRIDEKDEFGKYIGEIPLSNEGKAYLTGVIEGQELLAFFQRLTYHVSQISDFSKLPIPFKCLAVDIATVKPVVMDHGSLALAIRSSMSIPIVFKPVKLDGMLLVDGGMINNFPVKELKDMGADIVIGSYTGGRTYDAKELTTVLKLLTQSSLFYSIKESEDDIAMCDIFNNLNLNEKMKRLSSGDFGKFLQILKIGEELPLNVVTQLSELALKQQKTSASKGVDKSVLLKSFKIKSIAIDTIINPKLKAHILNQLPVHVGDSLNHPQLAKIVKELYGSRFFFKTFYTLNVKDSTGVHLKLGFEEDNKIRIKGAIHYDTERGIGLILNVTARNFIGKFSRFSLSGDLAETPKLRIDYQKYIFNNRNTLFKANYYTENTTQNIYTGTSSTQTKNLYLIAKSSYSSFWVGLEHKLGFNTSAAIGVLTESYTIKPKYNQIDILNFVSNTQYTSNAQTYAIKANIAHNTLNNANLPSRGSSFVLNAKLVFDAKGSNNITGYNVVKLINAKNDTTNKIDTIRINTNNYYGPYLKININYLNYLPLTRKIAMVTNVGMGAFVTNIFERNSTSPIGKYNYNSGTLYADVFYIGSVDKRPRTADFIPFWGLNEGEIIDNNYMAASLGIQYKLNNNFFINPMVSYLNHNNSLKELFSDLKSFNPLATESTSLLSLGMNFSMKTPIGAISFNLSKITKYSTIMGYFSFGYRF